MDDKLPTWVSFCILIGIWLQRHMDGHGCRPILFMCKFHVHDLWNKLAKSGGWGRRKVVPRIDAFQENVFICDSQTRQHPFDLVSRAERRRGVFLLLDWGQKANIVEYSQWEWGLRSIFLQLIFKGCSCKYDRSKNW